MNKITPDRIRRAVICIADEVEMLLRKAPKPYFNEQAMWAELSCCVLSSQVPYDLAKAAAQRIDDAGVLHNPKEPHPHSLASKLTRLLLIPLQVNNSCRRYRFPYSRSEQIASAFCAVYKEFGSLTTLVGHYPDAQRARAWMIAHLPGIGPKQASMFLRNAARCYDLAVIDRHVLRYMQLVGLCNACSSGVGTINGYERCEKQLRWHSESIGYPVGLLDWAIWIVMRAASTIGYE